MEEKPISTLAFFLTCSAIGPLAGAIVGFVVGTLSSNSDNRVYAPWAVAFCGVVLGAVLGPIVGFILLCKRDKPKN